MTNEPPGGPSMPRQSVFRAIYRDSSLVEQKLDLLALSLAKATMAAQELIPVSAELLRVYPNPDW